MSLNVHEIVRCLELCGNYNLGDDLIPCSSCSYTGRCEQLSLDAAELLREAYNSRSAQDQMYDHRVTWDGGAQYGDQR